MPWPRQLHSPIMSEEVILPAVKSGHQAALQAFDQIIAPAAQRFQPAMILVSAGFDAHYKDPLAKLTFQSPTYHALAGRLKTLANRLCGEPLSSRKPYALSGTKPAATFTYSGAVNGCRQMTLHLWYCTPCALQLLENSSCSMLWHCYACAAAAVANVCDC